MTQTFPLNRIIKTISRYNWFFLTAAIIVWMASFTNLDVDLWGHLRFGQDTLENWGVVRTDSYSYLTDGQSWINHEWLTEVFLAAAWQVDGVTGLILLKVAVCLVIAMLFYWQLRRQGNGFRSLLPVILFGFALSLQDTLTIRPQLFTFLCFTLLLIILIRAEGKYRLLWFTPLLFIVWVNLHGGVLAGYAIYSLWVVLQLFQRQISWKQALPPWLLSLLALLINPYGWDLPVLLLKTALLPRPEFVEWNPIMIRQPLGLIYLVSLVIGCLGVVYSRRSRAPVAIALTAVLALAPLDAVRHLSLYAAGWVLLVGEHVVDIGQSLIRRLPRWKPPVVIKWAMGVVSLLAGIGLLILAAPNFRRIVVPDVFPAPIVALLKQSQVSGRLITDYAWGEYAIYHLGPRLKVNIDGRRETVYTPEIYLENLNFLLGYQQWDALLTNHSADLAMLAVPSPAANLLRTHPDWAVIYDDNRFILFARQGTDQQRQLQLAVQSFQSPAPPWLFP